MTQTNDYERIRFIRKAINLTQAEFSNRLKISQAALSDIENGKNGFSYDVFKQLVDEFDINPEWLMTGTGDIYRKSYNAELPATLVHKKNLEGGSIPIVTDQYAYCGAVSGWADVSYDDFIGGLQTLNLPELKGLNCRAFVATGESMLPTIYPNDVLVCSAFEKNDTIKENYIYVIVTRDGMVTKRISPVRMSAESYLLRSDNKYTYPPYIISKNNILEMWLVRRRITAHLQSTDTLETRLAELENDMFLLKQKLK